MTDILIHIDNDMNDRLGVLSYKAWRVCRGGVPSNIIWSWREEVIEALALCRVALKQAGSNNKQAEYDYFDYCIKSFTKILDFFV